MTQGNRKTAKVFGVAVSAMLFALCASLEAQQPAKKILRMGYLGNAKPPSDSRREEAFFQGLRHYGWIEGQTLPSSVAIGKIVPSDCRLSSRSSFV